MSSDKLYNEYDSYNRLNKAIVRGMPAESEYEPNGQEQYYLFNDMEM